MRISRAETGEVNELRARASVSMLGVRLYKLTHDLTQTWRAGELQALRGVADDNGTKFDLQLTRGANNYSGKVNNKPVTLPLEAFPNTIWHYGIVDHPLLFNEVDLKLLKVNTVQANDTVEFGKKKIPAKKVTIKGDFAATVWFDRSRSSTRPRRWRGRQHSRGETNPKAGGNANEPCLAELWHGGGRPPVHGVDARGRRSERTQGPDAQDADHPQCHAPHRHALAPTSHCSVTKTVAKPNSNPNEPSWVGTRTNPSRSKVA